MRKAVCKVDRGRNLLITQRGHFQREAIKVDEPFGITLVIDIILTKGREFFIV